MIKNAILYCSCNFIRVGLNALVSSTYLSRFITITTDVNSIEQCEHAIKHSSHIDVIILVLSERDNNLTSVLKWLEECLPRVSPDCRVLLIGDKGSMIALEHYFSRLKNSWSTMPTYTSLTSFQTGILNLIRSSVGTRSDQNSIVRNLTPRELLVINKLLKGISPEQIAIDLQLSKKTISHHKRTGLAKLGMRSLCPLVMNINNGNIIQHIE